MNELSDDPAVVKLLWQILGQSSDLMLLRTNQRGSTQRLEAMVKEPSVS